MLANNLGYFTLINYDGKVIYDTKFVRAVAMSTLKIIINVVMVKCLSIVPQNLPRIISTIKIIFLKQGVIRICLAS